MLKRGPKIEDSVVVVTGASSGIGRATAQRFAEGGADLVLAARSSADLEDAARECRDRGAEVIAVPTDVASEQEVRTLAGAAVEPIRSRAAGATQPATGWAEPRRGSWRWAQRRRQPVSPRTRCGRSRRQRKEL